MGRPAKKSGAAKNGAAKHQDPKPLKVTFGENVKKERVKLKLSQEELAHQTGFCVSYVSMLERGQRDPSLATLGVFATTLNVTPGALLTP